MRTLILATLLTAALPVLALPTIAQAEVQHPKSLLALTPEKARSATSLTDDMLEPSATFSTEKAHRNGWGLFKTQSQDNHLRAVIDKTSGEARYEVRQFLRYWGAPRDYSAVQYETPQGVKTSALSLARHGNDVCPMSENNIECPLSKHIGFTVDEATLRRIAAGYQPGNAQGWGFKLKDETGFDVESSIVPAEAAGLLQAVDHYRATRLNRTPSVS
jgi:hypothetical protein